MGSNASIEVDDARRSVNSMTLKKYNSSKYYLDVIRRERDDGILTESEANLKIMAKCGDVMKCIEEESQSLSESQKSTVSAADGIVLIIHHCDICNKNFDTIMKYDVHVKFSMIHEQNVRDREDIVDAVVKASYFASVTYNAIVLLQSKKENKLNSIKVAMNTKDKRKNSKGIVPVQAAVELSVAKKRWDVCIKKVLLQNSVQKITTLLTKQLASRRIPGNDPVMIYSGTKIFWKVNISLDIQMALHDAQCTAPTTIDSNIISKTTNRKVIEIIPRNNNLLRELDRVYLDYQVLLDHLNPSIVVRVQEQSYELLNRNKGDSKMAAINMAKLFDELAHSMIIDFIINHLIIDTTTFKAVPGLNILLPENSPTLDLAIMPSGLAHKLIIPAPVYSPPAGTTRFAPLNLGHEFERTRNELKMEHNSIVRNTSEAQLQSEHVKRALNLLLTKRRSGCSDESPFRQKWRFAVNRVIAKNVLEDIKGRLKEIETLNNTPKAKSPTAKSPLKRNPHGKYFRETKQVSFKELSPSQRKTSTF